MIKKLILRFGTLLFLTSFLALSSCGGGGGGGGGGDGSGGEITYTGNVNRAVITTSNAATLVANVMGDAATTGTITPSRATSTAPSKGTNQAHLARRLSRHLRETTVLTVAARSAEPGTAAKIDVDESEPCDSGSIRTTGTLNDDGTGTLTASFDKCRFNGETLNGEVRVRIDVFNITSLLITDATFSFSPLSVTNQTFKGSFSGTIRFQVPSGIHSERLTVNVVTRDDTTSIMTKAENLLIVDVYDLGPDLSPYSETLTGRVFDSVYGFVDIDTLVPLIFNTIDQLFPDSGQLLFKGVGSTNARITVLSAKLVGLELDLDDGSANEVVATLQWADLGGEAGSDLIDSDGDEMHDSWETANGLDPSSPAGVDLDTDIDGFTNLEEYRCGTDPQDSDSGPCTAPIPATLWLSTPSSGSPEARMDHTAVWSGSKMIVWGGENGNALAKDSGAQFDSNSKTWSPTTLIGAPSPRSLHTAIWTGSEMIIWGGFSGAFNFVTLDDGARYSPDTNSWLPITMVDQPSARVNHTAVWTGTEMIVWGGVSCFACSNGELGTGGRYNPSTDTWTPMSIVNAPEARSNHTAVWTGSQMIIWGGETEGGVSSLSLLNSGGAYDPVTDTWTNTTLVAAPAPTRCHSAIWTGVEMIIFGGQTNTGLACGISSIGTGTRYEPLTDSWNSISDSPVSSTLSSARVIWTGDRLITWFDNEGARFNPANNTWMGVSADGSPSSRRRHTLVWTGSEMIVWGGGFAGPLDTGGIYQPQFDTTP